MFSAVFPGQGSQFPGMGKDLYESSSQVKDLFSRANTIVGFDLMDVMFNGTELDLKQTAVTQPAVFLHSIASFLVHNTRKVDMVAGHSLGEYTALVACKALSFEDAMHLVSVRAHAMQKACEKEPSTMLAVIHLSEEVVKDICSKTGVTVANYNSPSQIIISGRTSGIEKASELVVAQGGRAVPLNVGGAFHSPLMESARAELADAINPLQFNTPICPIYQNVDGCAHTVPSEIKANLISQLTSSVQWTRTVQNMLLAGATEFEEFGPGNVLKGLIKKINSEAVCIEQ